MGVVEGGCPTLTSGGWKTSAHHSQTYNVYFAKSYKSNVYAD